ncbi:MAG TPA: MFS transporter [Thermoanaerobaculia bacterium]|nr:MFS transporter [Thermoanaerobaculia bacterium]
MSGRRSDPRLALPALLFATVAVFADLYITQPILPLLTREFGVDAPTAALTVSVVVLAIALVSNAYGPLADARGRKPVMVASCAALAVPTLLCAAAPTFPALVGLRALQGALMPGVAAVAVAYLGDEYGGAALGPAVGSYVAASVLGGLTGRVASGWIASHSSWRAPFLVFGGLTLLGALGMALHLPASPGGRSASVRSAFREMAGHLRDRRIVGGLLIGGSVFFGFIAIFTYLPYYLTAPPFGLSTAQVSSVYLVYLAGIATSWTAGRAAERLGRRVIMAGGFLVAGAAVLGTLSGSVRPVVLGLVALCVGMFMVQGTAPAFVNAAAREAKGGAASLYTTFYYFGAALGSVLPGYAWQAWGWPGVVAACLAAFAAGLLSVAFLCA